MKKKREDYVRLWRSKIFRIMKLTMMLLLFGGMAIAANGYSQSTKINLRMKDASFVEFVKKIEAESDYFFFYKNDELGTLKEVDIDVNNASIEEILSKVLGDTNLTYKIVDQYVVISPKDGVIAKGTRKTQTSSKKVKGKVTDENGEPLPGVSVVVKGTTIGITSDFDGNYSLEVPPTGEVLVFSFVGMKSQEILLNGQTTINVVLAENAIGLDEVIAIGYGTTTKRVTTAAISKVKTDNLTNLPVTSIGETLAGRTAGLIVTNSGGGLGKRPTITVRGGGTPILIIDGVMTSNIDQMHRMNPKDIESFTILKDAEAVAIYGSKGGNGAIVITTKKGEKGKIRINYGYSRNFSKPTVLPSKMSSYDIVTYRNMAADNDKQERPYTDEVVQKYKDQSDPFNYPNVDWQKETLKDYASEYKHDLSLSGGDEKTQYYASLSYFDQGSLYKFNTNWLKRYTYRMSISNNFKKVGLQTTLSFFGDVEKTRAPYSHYSTGYWQTWGHIQNRSPMDLAYNELGLYSNGNDHPIVEIDPGSGYDKNEDRNVNGQLDVTWSVPKIKGLNLKFMGYYRNDSYFRKQWKVNADQYSLGSDVPSGKNPPSLNLYSGSGWRYRIQSLVTYDRTFDRHKVEALFGYDETYSHSQGVSASRENYVLGVDQIFAGPTDSSKNNGGESEYANAGYVGRLKYVYDKKYMIEGSVRYDGNDKFPKNNRWGTFYSGSVGWIVTEEEFARSLREKLNIDFFKLRFSYGETGLDNGVGRYEYLPGYSLNERAYVVDGKIVPGFSEGGLVSKDITWYERKSVNTGIDFAFLNNRFTGSADYFFYETVNYLGSPSGGVYTDPLGTSLPKVNTDGKHRRAGWEFEMKYKNHIGDLHYDVGVNLTKFDQLWVVKHDESEDQLKNPKTRETHQTGIGRRSYITDGFYYSAEDVMNSPKRNNSHSLVPGDLKYSDVNGDGQIDGEDFVRSGKPSFPRVMYGFTVDLKYKAWTMGMHFQGTGDRHVYLDDIMRNRNASSIRYGFQTDFWTPENTDARYPRLISNENFNGNNNGVSSDFWLVNARYFRMKSLQLSYDFKQDLFRNLPFSNCDLFVSGTNLFTISKLFSKYKMDPETGSANNYGYPLQKVFSVGINVGF
ncbi:SusC/RagA family TonB-linked outer membrane protein [Puteibacter caeruleilacunae]|nr:SusC/RagA family TonB-linked outer membrane protein [Puteibacter caeruleilacunae]